MTTALVLVVASFGTMLGALARYLVYERVPAIRPPLPTVIVNVSGAFVIGILGTLGALGRLPHLVDVLLVPGVLGGYTTFSTLANEVAQLMGRRRMREGIAHVALNLGPGLAAAFAASLGTYALWGAVH